MESEWRLNVTDMGWNYSVVRLIARNPAGFGPDTVMAAIGPPGGTNLVLFALLEGGYARLDDPFLVTFLSGSFPFGHTVDPDH